MAPLGFRSSEVFVICWVESVDPVADLCLANQIYSVLLNASESKEITEVFHEDGEKRTRRCKTFKFSEIPIEDREAGRFVLASTRHHRARLLKYYPRPPCAPSFVKSRMLCPLQTDFWQGFGLWAKTLRGQKY